MTDPISSIDSAREREIEIDAYMAEQGEEDIPTLPGSLTIEQKVARIKYLRDKPMVAGDTWYIISRQWFRPWEIACGILSDKSLESLQEKDIGPPDNSSLFDSQGNLTSNLVEHIDVEFLPEEAWSELVAWYVLLLDFIHFFMFLQVWSADKSTPANRHRQSLFTNRLGTSSSTSQSLGTQGFGSRC
jgi:ubiquitin carboxyl-terminal hydrolase 4/11/15